MSPSETQHQTDRRPRAQLTDYFYLILAAMSLLQVPGTIESSGVWPGVLFAVVTVMFLVLIAVGNRGRFLPLVANRYKQ
jgi:hypothetical protein